MITGETMLIYLSFLLISFAFILIFLRFLVATRLEEVLLLVDSLSYFITLFLIIYASYYSKSYFIDFAFVTAVLSFASTISIARTVLKKWEKRGEGNEFYNN